MSKNLSLKIKSIPLFVIVNILLFSIIVMLFRINVLKKKEYSNRKMTESLATEINEYFESKQDIVRSISGIKHIIDVSSGKVNTEEEDFITKLDLIKLTIGASVVYLMNSEGLVIGSSTYDKNKTLLGQNYKFRPYFKEAIEGQNSFYTAVGVTTYERGMYFGFPVKRGGETTGVIVVKFNLTMIDNIIERSKMNAFMVSPQGIIFSASKEEWLYKSILPLNPEKLEKIKRSRQFGRFNVGNFQYDVSGYKVDFNGKKCSLESFDLKMLGWKIYSISCLDLRLNYVIPFAVFILMLLVELLIINSIRDYRLIKLSEMSLSESRERFMYLFESVMDLILILDKNGNILDANPISKKMFGYLKKELLGKSFRILFQGDSQKIYEKQMRIVSMELRSRFEFRGRKKDKSDIFLDCSMVLLRREGVDSTSYFVTCSDITERKEAEVLLKIAKEEAEKANSSKSQFLANMSHEIRTPMNAILGFSELLESSKLNNKQKEYLTIIKQSGESLLYLIDEILDFSKIEAGKLQIEKKNFELDKILEEIKKTINIWIKDDKLKLIVNVEKGVPKYLNGDPERLKQILLNLLNNAVKFTEKGEIRLNVYLNKDVDHWVSLGFSVKDTGIGISKGDTDKLFKSFSQIDSALARKYEGTGLGLAITSKLVEMMGGTMKVESDLGKGSHFYFSINFGKADSAGDPNKSSADKKMHFAKQDMSRYSLLVVEDNSVNRMLLDYTLKREGFVVTTAINGDEALKLIEEREFDVILMDIQMPGKDGVEVTREIRKTKRKNIPVIALTANAMKGDREKYINLGLDDYLSKPIKKRELINVVIKWIIESKGK